MVLSGGAGVVAVVIFVAALAFGAEAESPAPGSRLGIAKAAGPAGLAILIPRCRSERVTRVEVRSINDVALWRVVSRKGSIDERFVVGAESVPLGFATDVALAGPLPAGPSVAVAELAGEPSDTADRATFEPGAVPAEGVLYQGRAVNGDAFQAQAASAADCGGSGRGLGLVTWLFMVAAATVVVTYGMMVVRYWRGRHEEQ